MTIYSNQSFASTTVFAQGNTYNNCTFQSVVFSFANGGAIFSGGSITDSLLVEPLSSLCSTSIFSSVQLQSCDIDTTFKVFNYCTLDKACLLDGSRLESSNTLNSTLASGHGATMQGCQLTDTTLSGPEPFWLYGSSNNIFFGQLRSMPMQFSLDTGAVSKSWSELRVGATVYGSNGCSDNRFVGADGLTLLGTGIYYTQLTPGDDPTGRRSSTAARDVRASFAVLGGCNATLTDSVLAYTTSSSGPNPMVGSRTIADASDYLAPQPLCEGSSFVDAYIPYYNDTYMKGSLRGTSMRGADLTNSFIPYRYTNGTDVTGTNGLAALDPQGVATSGTHTQGANNLDGLGVQLIASPLTTMLVSPVLAPGQAYLVAVSLGNSVRYNYVVEDALASSVSAYILSYGAVLKSGLTSFLMNTTPGMRALVKKHAAAWGDQLQDTYAQVPSTTAYLLVVNDSADMQTVGISGRTGVVNATGLIPGDTYDLTDMTSVSGISSSQAWGTLRYNQSVDGTTLYAKGHQYDSGFGTHADASITVPTTANVVGTFVGYAYDNTVREALPGPVSLSHYSLKSDSTTVLTSSDMHSWDKASWAFKTHSAGTHVTLQAQGVAGNVSCHVDFLYPTFVRSRGAYPTLTSVTPNIAHGGSPASVTLTGTGFVAGASVTFGGVQATGVTVVDATTITCTTGAIGSVEGAQVVDVRVTNADLRSVTMTGAYTFTGVTDVNIASPLSTLIVSPLLAPGQAYLVQIPKGNSSQKYNYVVENSLASSVNAYVMSYSALVAAGISSSVTNTSPAMRSLVASSASASGLQLQDTYANVPSNTAYLLVVNNSSSASVTVGVSGRTGVINAASLVSGNWYDLADMTTVSGISSSQAWGSLHYNQSVDGTTLATNGHQFSSGFGTHASASITVPTTANVVGTYVGFTYDYIVWNDSYGSAGVTKYILSSGGTTQLTSANQYMRDPTLWVFKGHSAYANVTLQAQVNSGNASCHIDFLNPTLIMHR